MALRYEEGELKLAVTRGDGIIQGEDVTANARVISDVKKKMKRRCHISKSAAKFI